MADRELSTQDVRKAPTAPIAALELSTQMALKQCRPRVSVPLALTRTAMAKRIMLSSSHLPFKEHPVVGTGHQKLKMWGDQATGLRWVQRLTAFRGAQRRYMMLPVENTPDIAT